MSLSPLPLSRREALGRILAATALGASLHGFRAVAAEETPGIGFDPNLLKKEIPWPRLLTEAEKRTVTALADAMLPADDLGPAASAVGVPDFIDEWVSAPYEQQVKERKTVREGLAALDVSAREQHGKGFADLSTGEQTALLEKLFAKGQPSRTFLALFRDRAAGGYYTTPEGWKALGYTGNLPMIEFPGPTPEALAHIGLA